MSVMHSRHRAFSCPWHLMAVAIYVALACIRIPALVHHGRFWAEEGTIYFITAWNLSWWQALLKPAVGYLSLAANSAALLARYSVPLQDAPLITTGVALAVQTFPVLLLATASDAWLSRPVVLLAAVLILSMPPVCDEVWLNTVNSQFHLALAAALCLVLRTRSGLQATAQNLLLFMCPLCSPGSVALVPLFAMRAVMDRDRRRSIQALCIATGAALQVLFFYTPLPGRGHFFSPAALVAIIAVKHLAIPFLGEDGAAFVSHNVRSDVLAAHFPVVAFLAVAAASVLLLSATAIIRRPEPLWLLASGAAIASLSYYGALDGADGLTTVIAGNRYIFAPCMLFALGVLALAASNVGRVSAGAWVIVVWLLAIAVRQTLLPPDRFFAEGPSWRDEVTRWQADHGRPLAIWPVGLIIHLQPHP